MAMGPPCNCKPSNVNNLAPMKAPFERPRMIGFADVTGRPSLAYSLDVNIPNIFEYDVPDNILVWTSSAGRANPKIQRTPRKGKRT